LSIDKSVAISPLPAAQLTELLPEQKKQFVALLKLLASCLLQYRDPSAILSPCRLEFRNPDILTAGGTSKMLVRLLVRLVLRLGVSVSNTLLFEQLGKLAALKGMRLE
jgi:hypothetical protein